ncbi:hypothetical protein H0H93_013937 [Arthromyces matolae]|nr:hypothetical protein H0H93_013937 [Arthromyces matolae]
MLNSLSQIPSNDSPYIKSTKFNQNLANNHGVPDNRILLDVPSETLTGITSYLDPPSLLSLARVHSRLAAHVKNDNTWHRAFVCQFLGISPESDIHDDVKSLMLRRSETTWRNEFINRYRLRRRWERSRNPTVAHVPVHSDVSSMHMMPNTGLLASSIRYGIVSRSLPLTGKVLPGYLDASGLRLGLGVGNPNAEFTPNVSICAISSDGGTARIFWGFQHGEVGILTAPRVIDASKRPISELIRCPVGEEHTGAVVDAVWDDLSSVVVTGGADGVVKLWDAKTVRCLWASERQLDSILPDPCCKVAVSVAAGLVTAVMRSGDIIIWSGFVFNGDFSSTGVVQNQTPCPVQTSTTSSPADSSAPHIASVLRFDSDSSLTSVLVAYEDNPYFYRLRVNKTNVVEISTFGDAAFGSLSCITPFFSSTNEPSFVLAGDRMGYVSLYDWNSLSSSDPIQCIRKFEAHEDAAAVTALAWNGLTLITGSARGTIHVWDGLTFEPLRSFASPVPRIRARSHHPGREHEPVRQILVNQEKQVMMVSVGDRVLAWVAGPVSKNSPGGVRGRHTSGSAGKKKKDKNGTAKYLQQVELHQSIAESKTMLKHESEHTQRAHGRVRDQLAQLENLGLDEAEAVQYILMLSRDEAQQDEYSQAFISDEGIFDNFDFDDALPNRTHPVASSSSPYIHSNYSSGTNTPTKARTTLRASPSKSNVKVQLSSPYRSEPREAGRNDTSTSNSNNSTPSASSDEAHFPPVSASASPPSPMSGRAWKASRSSISRASSSGSQGSVGVSVSIGGHSGGSLPGSPQSYRSSTSAWATPLRHTPTTPVRSPVVLSTPSSVRSNRGASIISEEEMDEELRYALELSLAEARSRGENV